MGALGAVDAASAGRAFAREPSRCSCAAGSGGRVGGVAPGRWHGCWPLPTSQVLHERLAGQARRTYPAGHAMCTGDRLAPVLQEPEARTTEDAPDTRPGCRIEQLTRRRVSDSQI